MKLIKQIALVALLAVGMYGAVIYASCNKDTCKTVTCLNGGTCNGDGCTCDTSGGVGGTNCQIIYRNLYGGTNGSGGYYVGNAIINYSPTDSAYMNHTDANDTLTFSYVPTDSAYSTMTLKWGDAAGPMLTTPITLTNNMVTGSTFSVSPTAGGPGDTFSVSGNGSVNSTTASLTLTEVPPHPNITPTILVTLSSCVRQ